MAISLSYHKLFTIGVDSLSKLMMLKWSHATDITNMGQFNHHFKQNCTLFVCSPKTNQACAYYYTRHAVHGRNIVMK